MPERRLFKENEATEFVGEVGEADLCRPRAADRSDEEQVALASRGPRPAVHPLPARWAITCGAVSCERRNSPRSAGRRCEAASDGFRQSRRRPRPTTCRCGYAPAHRPVGACGCSRRARTRVSKTEVLETACEFLAI